MSKFSEQWKNEVKPLAMACIPDMRIVEIIGLDDGDGLLPDEAKYLEEMSHQYKDLYGMYNIWCMVRWVEDAISEKNEQEAQRPIANVLYALNNPEYFKNTFEGDKENEEWQRLNKLREGLKKLQKLLR